VHPNRNKPIASAKKKLPGMEAFFIVFQTKNHTPFLRLPFDSAARGAAVLPN
jgi:hypothetical protein